MADKRVVVEAIPKIDYSAPFRTQQQQISAAIQAITNQVQRTYTEEFLKEVMEETPVLSGYLLSEWQVGVGSAPQGVIAPKSEAQKRQLTKISAAQKASIVKRVLSRFRAQKLSITDRSRLYIVNNCDYAVKAEYTGWGENRKPPYMMVGKALAKHEKLLQRTKTLLGLK